MKPFDVDDYESTYIVTRNAYLKAALDMKLTIGPYIAARDAYATGANTYARSLYA